MKIQKITGTFQITHKFCKLFGQLFDILEISNNICKVPRQSGNSQIPERLKSFITSEKDNRQPEKCTDKP